MLPAGIEEFIGVTLIETSDFPVPLSEMTCGELLALSVIWIVPLRVPEAVGVNVTTMVQLALAERLAPHVFVCAKSPLATMLVSKSGLPPVFVTETF